MSRSVAVVGGLLLILVACRPSAEVVADGDDALAALAAPAQSARYDGPFWTREAHRRTRTWLAAKAFCERRPTLPNCHPVKLVEWWEEGASNQPALPVLPPPPSPPPALHPGEAGYVGADVEALKVWEARLAARAHTAPQRVQR